MNWPIKKLGEVADILMGQSPPSLTYNLSGNGLPFFQGKAEFGDLYPKINKYCSAPIRIAEGGDILLSVRAPVGPINLAQEKSCIGRGLSAIRAKNGFMDQWYLYYLLKQHESNWNGSTGSTFQATNKTIIENLEFPTPDLIIQKKIVERLDVIRKAQELCDQQIQKTEELFDSIIGEFENKQTGLMFKLEDLLVEPLQNGVNFSKTQMGNGTLLVNVKDVYTENEIEEDKLNRISITEKEIATYSLHEGDVLFVRSSVKRDGVGFTAIFKSVSNEPIVYSGFIMKARVDTRKILPQYLLYVTRSKHLRKRIIESSGTGTITNINQGSINRLQILVPDLKIQQEIVEKVEAVQNYKKLLQKEKALLRELFDSVLDKSMKGELDINVQ